MTALTGGAETAGSFDLTQYLMAKLQLQDFENARPARPVNSVLDQDPHQWRARNPADRAAEPERLTYKQYRLQ